jgi:uncharacterized Tic20 family protein
MLSENKLQDQDKKNHINFKIVITLFHIIAAITAIYHEPLATQSLDIEKS